MSGPGTTNGPAPGQLPTTHHRIACEVPLTFLSFKFVTEGTLLGALSTKGVDVELALSERS